MSMYSFVSDGHMGRETLSGSDLMEMYPNVAPPPAPNNAPLVAGAEVIQPLTFRDPRLGPQQPHVVLPGQPLPFSMPAPLTSDLAKEVDLPQEIPIADPTQIIVFCLKDDCYTKHRVQTAVPVPMPTRFLCPACNKNTVLRLPEKLYFLALYGISCEFNTDGTRIRLFDPKQFSRISDLCLPKDKSAKPDKKKQKDSEIRNYIGKFFAHHQIDTTSSGSSSSSNNNTKQLHIVEYYSTTNHLHRDNPLLLKEIKNRDAMNKDPKKRARHDSEIDVSTQYTPMTLNELAQNLLAHETHKDSYFPFIRNFLMNFFGKNPDDVLSEKMRKNFDLFFGTTSPAMQLWDLYQHCYFWGHMSRDAAETQVREGQFFTRFGNGFNNGEVSITFHKPNDLKPARPISYHFINTKDSWVCPQWKNQLNSYTFLSQALKDFAAARNLTGILPQNLSQQRPYDEADDDDEGDEDDDDRAIYENDNDTSNNNDGFDES